MTYVAMMVYHSLANHVIFHGKMAHAVAFLSEGVNALDAPSIHENLVSDLLLSNLYKTNAKPSASYKHLGIVFERKICHLLGSTDMGNTVQSMYEIFGWMFHDHHWCWTTSFSGPNICLQHAILSIEVSLCSKR